MDAEKVYYVYAYLRSKNSSIGKQGEPYYIGKGKNERAYEKSHSVNPPADKVNIKFLAENMNEADALQAEMLLICKYGRVDLQTGCLRNHTDGGKGVKNSLVTKERRNQISAALKGRVLTQETKNKISESEKGKLVSEETKRKIRLARGKQIFTDETKLKMAKSAIGKLKSDTHRGNISKAVKNAKKTECHNCQKLFTAHHMVLHQRKCLGSKETI
jgi:hypothetical protein